MKFVLRVLFTALGVLAAASIVPGITIASFWVAVLVALVLGLLNITLGALLKILTLPLSIVTFGLFFLVINALMFWAASFVKGFAVAGFWPAFWGSIIVTLVSIIGKKAISE
ncbi:MAG: phage holin family protein [Candidatus Doudnabacteria bacterium]|nr:phage holin family protein [Candidatus Doudnabacteria bacterium]